MAAIENRKQGSARYGAGGVTLLTLHAYGKAATKQAKTAPPIKMEPIFIISCGGGS